MYVFFYIHTHIILYIQSLQAFDKKVKSSKKRNPLGEIMNELNNKKQEKVLQVPA